jgi:Transposase DNA-binding/Transposase Tn5 dimerisation domain
MEWAGKELSEAELGDDRRALRLMRMVETLVEHAEQSVPEGFGSWSETKAAYRFFENDRIAWPEILAPHRASTVRRAAAEPVVLVAQDTTEINLSQFPATAGLGYLGSPKCRGVLLHTCLAMNPEGVVLGVIDQQMWIRPVEELGKRDARRQKPTADKESQRWLDGLQATQTALAAHPQVVVVADSEADIYDLFAAPRAANTHLLVRVSRPQRCVEHPEKYLGPAVESTPVRGALTVDIPRSSQRPPRRAEMSVRWLTISIRPPQARAANLPSLSLQFVLIEEINPPAGETPVRWFLATTLPVESLTQAKTCVQYYVRRWLIERFHYTLKSGCLVEQRRFEIFENICRAVACFSIAAWRLLWLMTEAREHPDQPCTVVLSQPEWEALEAVAQQRFHRPARGQPPTLGEAVQLIGKLGGHLGRKRDGPPGIKTLWRGLSHLSYITTGWLLPRPP